MPLASVTGTTHITAVVIALPSTAADKCDSQTRRARWFIKSGPRRNSSYNSSYRNTAAVLSRCQIAPDPRDLRRGQTLCGQASITNGASSARVAPASRHGRPGLLGGPAGRTPGCCVHWSHAFTPGPFATVSKVGGQDRKPLRAE